MNAEAYKPFFFFKFVGYCAYITFHHSYLFKQNITKNVLCVQDIKHRMWGVYFKTSLQIY